MSEQIESTPIPPCGGAEDMTFGDDWDDPEMDDVLTHIKDLSVLENDVSMLFDPQWSPTDLAETVAEIPQESATKKTRKKYRTHKQKNEKMRCLVCVSKVSKMRDHLNKHNLPPGVKEYLLDFYRTKHKKFIFECEQCMRRFVNNRKHRIDFKDHEIRKINKPADKRQLLHAVKTLCCEIGTTTKSGRRLIEDFVDHERTKMAITGMQEESFAKTINTTTQTHLAKLLYESQYTKYPEVLPRFCEKMTDRYNYKAATVVLFLNQVKKLIIFISNYRNMYKCPKDVWVDTISSVKKGFAAAQSKETLVMQEEKNLQVPTVQELGKVLKEVVKVLTEKKQELTYKEKLGLNFLLLQARLDIRPAPLLNLKPLDFKKVLRMGQKIGTTKHKTGKTSKVTISRSRPNSTTWWHAHDLRKRTTTTTDLFVCLRNEF